MNVFCLYVCACMCMCVHVHVRVYQLPRQRIMLMFHVHLQCENTHTHMHTQACMLQSSGVFQCEGAGGCFWCHPAVPMTSICGRRPARPAILLSAEPAMTSKL